MNSTAPIRRTASAVPIRQGLPFEVRFATHGKAPFDQIEWDLRTAEITDDRSKAMFRQENVELPKPWSELQIQLRDRLTWASPVPIADPTNSSVPKGPTSIAKGDQGNPGNE